MKKEKQLNIRIGEEEKQLLEEDAKSEHRSISNFLLWCWKEWRESKKRTIEKPKGKGLLD